MADEVTSTDRKMLYKVCLRPNGEEIFVEGNGAVDAHRKGQGIAALDEIYYNGMTVERATESEITDYYGDEEE